MIITSGKYNNQKGAIFTYLGMVQQREENVPRLLIGIVKDAFQKLGIVLRNKHPTPQKTSLESNKIVFLF